MDTLLRLQLWYAAQCNGDWEHQSGIRVGTLDNPGWSVEINLVDTPLEGQSFVEIAEGVGPDTHPYQSRWLHCSIRDGAWHGVGDETQLNRLLILFLDWADQFAS